MFYFVCKIHLTLTLLFLVTGGMSVKEMKAMDVKYRDYIKHKYGSDAGKYVKYQVSGKSM